MGCALFGVSILEMLMTRIDTRIENNRLGGTLLCWVCSKPKDTLTFEDHHIVPQHLGGKNGPVVLLCGVCHTQVHNSAEALYKGNTHIPFRDAVQREKCLYLATVIVNARLAVEANGGLNKRFVFSTVFTYEEHETLVKLTKHYGMNQPKLIKYALEQLAKRTF